MLALLPETVSAKRKFDGKGCFVFRWALFKTWLEVEGTMSVRVLES